MLSKIQNNAVMAKLLTSTDYNSQHH